jgi:hypothetical protein
MPAVEDVPAKPPIFCVLRTSIPLHARHANTRRPARAGSVDRSLFGVRRYRQGVAFFISSDVISPEMVKSVYSSVSARETPFS